MLYTIQSDIISLLCFYYSHVWSKYSINITGCLNFTCCQYSSKDGSADRYPVSRTLCSSWKILHMGITSISLPRADLSNPAGNPGKGAFPPCLHARREGNSLFLFSGRSDAQKRSKVQILQSCKHSHFKTSETRWASSPAVSGPIRGFC